MKHLKILPYKMNSLSSRAISKHFKCKRVYPNKNYKPKDGDVIVNWGFCGVAPVLESSSDNFTILNKPIACDRASDKIATLKLLKQNNVPHVNFVLNKGAAKAIVAAGEVVYCRTLTRGKEGNGIVLAKSHDDVVEAKLYTRYFKNDTEFRVHVFNGEVIDVVQKKSMSSERIAKFAEKGVSIVKDDNSKYIRNMKKAWSFCRQDIIVKDHVLETAVNATKALELDFAAVDIAYDSETDKCAVLELNTAPGQKLKTTTNFRYARAISKFLDKELSLEEYNKRYNCDLKEV